MFLGREEVVSGPFGKLGWLDRKSMIAKSTESLNKTNIRVASVLSRAGRLSGGQHQAVAVGRAVSWGTRVLLLDEPTAALGVEQQHRVGELIKQVAADNIAVLLISHNIPQVYEICGRVVVLFRGETVANLKTSEIEIDDVVGWIHGLGPSLHAKLHGGGSQHLRRTCHANRPWTRSATSARRSHERFMESIGQFWTFGVLVVLIVIFGTLAPDMYSKDAWLSTSEFAVEYLILAVGQTFVIITAGIDLSDGAILGFSAMVGAKLMEHMMGGGGGGTATVVLGIAAMLLTGAAVSVFNGVLITKIKLPPFIVTLGTLTAFTGATT